VEVECTTMRSGISGDARTVRVQDIHIIHTYGDV